MAGFNRRGKTWTQQREIVAPEYRTSPDGILHASASEMGRWNALRLLESRGWVKELYRQVRFPLEMDGVSIKTPTGRTAYYTPDFVYKRWIDGEWVLIIEEHKGYMDPLAQFRISVFEALYKVKVTVTK